MRKLWSIIAASLVLSIALGAQAMAVDLTMYYPVSVGGPITKIVDGLIADYEKDNPGVRIKAVYAGNYDDTRTKAMAALKSGEPVQLSVLFSIDAFDLRDQDLIVPFDELAKTDADRQWMKSFYPGLMENGQIDGKVWGIPFQRSTIVMYYNKDAFRAAGLDPEHAPATWDELVSMGKKLTKRDASGKVSQWGVEIPSTGYPYWMFQALCIQNGQKLMQDGNKVFFDSKPAVEALTFWKDLGGKHGVMPQGTVEWGTLRQTFLEGKTAIMWHSTGNLTAVKKNASFDFGVAMLPANKRLGSPTGGGNFYVFKRASAEEREASLKFIQWMTAPEQSAKWSMGTGYVGTSAAAYQTEALKEYAAGFPAAAVARDQLKYAVAEFSTHETARVKKFLDDAIQSTLTGASDPAKALAKAQKSAERVLRGYK
ncbi:ABC transporter substrate-binding protein [Desulfocurvus sp. DL9XJH121]